MRALAEIPVEDGIQTVTCRDWEEFKTRIISDHFPDRQFRRGSFLFRGQGSSAWELSSTFDRWFQGNRASNRTSLAEALFNEFKRECELEEIPDQVRNDELAMLGLAQHHGLPTRLLDWSESPYIAAFFAFSGHVRHERRLNFEKFVAVWVLASGDYVWDEQNGCALVKVPAYWNNRIHNQLGRFTYLRAPYSSLEKYIEQFPSPFYSSVDEFEAGERSLMS
jgi:hypothetical protein